MSGEKREKLVTKRLPLSHLVYRDGNIDSMKADQLVVYHYTLSKSYKWREWEQQLDDQLSDPDLFYPYLMRSYQGQFGLFVALDDPSAKPPKILNGDGEEVQPQRVHYARELNPIWIRLIMRKVRAFDAHCIGSHTLGRPILKIDSWPRKGESPGGINAISLDCRTQMLKGGGATEIVLFHENVPLREDKQSNDSGNWRGSLWKYSRNNVLMRWFPEHGKKSAGSVYREIRKNKNKRTQRAFLDVGSAKALEKSWPYILKPVQDAFVEEARKFGFTLEPKVLNLRPLPLKTKYRSNAKKSSFSSLWLGGKVEVIDLRFSKSVTSKDLIEMLQGFLDRKGINTKLEQYRPVEPDDISSLEFGRHQRVLVLLDQTPNIVNDRYPLTVGLRNKVACQHINVNPNDLAVDAVEKGLLAEVDGVLIPISGSSYYDYDLKQYKDTQTEKALVRNLEVVIKELELKSLLLDPNAKVSEVLPAQASLLNEKMVVITDGYMFTVKSNRPVLVPFDPSDSAKVRLCDSALSEFGLSVAKLLASLQKDWPYNYRPEVVMQGFGSPTEKLTRFARRLTFVIEKGDDGVSVMFQDPKYETPHMLPDGLVETRDRLCKQEKEYELKHWLLPDIEEVRQALYELEREEIITKASAQKLGRELLTLTDFWKDSLRALLSEGFTESTYRSLKGAMFDRWKKQKYPELDDKERKKKNDTKLISLWDELLSYVLKLPLRDAKGWVRDIPGVSKLWYDEKQHYFIVGGIASPKNKILRQPSIRQWHSLIGRFNPELITALVDVDWVRMNQLAGNPCVATLIRRWRECQKVPEQALGVELLNDELESGENGLQSAQF